MSLDQNGLSPGLKANKGGKSKRGKTSKYGRAGSSDTKRGSDVGGEKRKYKLQGESGRTSRRNRIV